MLHHAASAPEGVLSATVCDVGGAVVGSSEEDLRDQAIADYLISREQFDVGRGWLSTVEAEVLEACDCQLDDLQAGMWATIAAGDFDSDPNRIDEDDDEEVGLFGGQFNPGPLAGGSPFQDVHGFGAAVPTSPPPRLAAGYSPLAPTSWWTPGLQGSSSPTPLGALGGLPSGKPPRAGRGAEVAP